MFTMISEYGNEIAYAEDEEKRDYYIGLGFRVLEEKKRAPKTTKKGVGKNETENEDGAEIGKS